MRPNCRSVTANPEICHSERSLRSRNLSFFPPCRAAKLSGEQRIFGHSQIGSSLLAIHPLLFLPINARKVHMTANIPVSRTSQSRLSEELRENSTFGTNFSDHMFVADYRDDAWHDARIEPFGPMSFSPAMTALHYGQSLFEGFKAHRTADGGVAMFRPMANHASLNRTAARLAMPEIPEEIFREGLLELIRVDKEWTPCREGGSLSVRPVYFGTDDSLMVRPATR